MILLGPGFHAKMDACLADLADLPHGNLTAYNRTRAKADANYTGMAKPQSQVPQGVIQYEDVPAEIQFNFRSVQLMKGSSHAACAPTRVELAACGGFPRDAEPRVRPAPPGNQRLGGGGTHTGRGKTSCRKSRFKRLYYWRQDDAVPGCRLASFFYLFFLVYHACLFAVVLFSCCCLCCVFSLCFLSSIKIPARLFVLLCNTHI
jgi:hypothetical protein